MSYRVWHLKRKAKVTSVQLFFTFIRKELLTEQLSPVKNVRRRTYFLSKAPLVSRHVNSQRIYYCFVFIVNISINKYFTNSSKRFWFKVVFREWTHVLLLNTPYSYLHSVFRTGMSSGLANRMNLALASRGVGRVYYTGVDLLLVSFYIVVRDWNIAF